MGTPTYFIYTDKGQVFDVDQSLNRLQTFSFEEIGFYRLLQDDFSMVDYKKDVYLLNPGGNRKATLRVSSDLFTIGDKIYAFSPDRKRLVEISGIEE